MKSWEKVEPRQLNVVKRWAMTVMFRMVTRRTEMEVQKVASMLDWSTVTLPPVWALLVSADYGSLYHLTLSITQP